MFEDVSRRKGFPAVRQNEPQLPLFAKIIENIRDAVLVTDAELIDMPGPRIVYANPAFLAMTGYDASELIGQTPRILQGEKTDREELARIRSALQNKTAVHVELVNYRKDGTEFDVEFEIVPLIDEQGRATHFISTQRETTARNQAERIRREENEKLDRMIAAIPGILGSLRLGVDGTPSLPYVSPRFQSTFGISPSLLTEDASEFFARIHPDDAANINARLADSARAMTPYYAEFRYLTPDNRWIWCEARSTPIQSKDGSIVWHGVVMDITDRKRAEDALRETEQHLTAAIEAVRLGLWKWDIKTNVVSISGHTESLYGLAPGTFDGQVETLTRFVHPDDVPQVLQVRDWARKTGTEYTVVYRVIWPDGSIHWLSGSGRYFRNASGELAHAAGTIFDVTERKALLEERLHLLTIAERRAVTLAAARRVALDILVSRTGIEALRHIVEAALLLSHATKAVLSIVEPASGQLQAFITSGFTPEEEAAFGAHKEGQGILGQLLAQTVPVRINDGRAQLESAEFRLLPPQIRSFLGVPILSGKDVLGNLSLMNREGGIFTEEDEASITALAEYAGVAIHNQHLLQQQSELTHRFIDTLEEERRSVAYDLHDGLTQYIMAANVFLDTYAERYRNRPDVEMPETLAQGLACLNQGVLEARRFVNGLRALSLDELGLAGALELLIDEEKERAGWETVDFRQNIGKERFDQDLETAVFRIAQESLSNARKHAQATKLQVWLHFAEQDAVNRRTLILEVRDDGKGFDTARKTKATEHLGLYSMEERARLTQGSLEIRSAPGSETVIRAIFPLSPPHTQHT